jgi:polyisoprenoid-binding protein YceI
VFNRSILKKKEEVMKNILLTLVVTLIMYTLPVSAAVYTIDHEHTDVGFSVRHMVISNVKGFFETYEADFDVDKNNRLTTAKAVIQAASIDTKIEKRDNHLRSPDFFDVAKFPTITFNAATVKHTEGNSFVLTGDLTIRGITRAVSLEGEINGPVKDPWGNVRMGIILRGKILRKDFGLTWNKVLETGGLLVGESVTMTIEGEGILKK